MKIESDSPADDATDDAEAPTQRPLARPFTPVTPPSLWADATDLADLEAIERSRRDEAYERPPHY